MIPIKPEGRYDRLFYGGMAVALALTVLIGFAPTYYLKLVSSGPTTTISGRPFTSLVHVHGALFTAWVVLFVVQTAFVASRRIAAHRRMGIAGAILAVAMIVVGTRLAIATAATPSAPDAPAAAMPPLEFLAIPLFDMILFAGFIAAALLGRRNREAHKRLMLLAYLSIITAAAGRLPLAQQLGPLLLTLSFVFLAAALFYDWWSRGRVHKAYVRGGLLLVVSVPLRVAIASTSAWHALAERLTR